MNTAGVPYHHLKVWLYNEEENILFLYLQVKPTQAYYLPYSCTVLATIYS